MVAFDAAPLRPRPAGVGVYVRELARALVGIANGGVAFIGVRDGGELQGLPPELVGSRLGESHHQVWLHLHADREAQSTGARLVHYTNASAPVRVSLPYVLTVQDLSVVRRPHGHPPSRLATLPVMALAAHRAAAVIVPSRATARDLQHWFGVGGRRTVVVEHAPTPRPTDAHTISRTLDRYGLTGRRYVLCVSTIEPRKNHVRLVAAFERVAQHHPDLQLVLVGGLGWGYGPILGAIERSPAAGRIHRLGYVSDGDLGALMLGAAALVYPSLLEGYGLPIVEAIALGVPVVASRIGSTSEAAGGAARLVDPRDEASIAQGIEDAILRRGALGEAGTRRSGRTWGDVARETWEVYAWAASTQRPNARR